MVTGDHPATAAKCGGADRIARYRRRRRHPGRGSGGPSWQHPLGRRPRRGPRPAYAEAGLGPGAQSTGGRSSRSRATGSTTCRPYKRPMWAWPWASG
jgi:hypothetical protein